MAKGRLFAPAGALAGALLVLYLLGGAGGPAAAALFYPGGFFQAAGQALAAGGKGEEKGVPPADTPAPAQALALPAAATGWQPAENVPRGMAAVAAVTYGPGADENTVPCGAGWVWNCTDLSAGTVADAVGAALPFSVQVDDGPVVLIMHTHATERYLEEPGQYCDPAFSSRTTDTSRNMVRVGAEIASVLNAAGVPTVQDATLHDYPSYNGSYTRSRATVEDWLAKYPSIRVVLDIHRDAIEREDGTRIKPFCTVNGVDTAQVMIICGADNGALGLPHFRENLKFACRLEDAMERQAPGLTRPVLFDYRQYNQHLTTGSLLLEIGGHGNTLAEALSAARQVGAALATLLING